MGEEWPPPPPSFARMTPATPPAPGEQPSAPQSPQLPTLGPEPEVSAEMARRAPRGGGRWWPPLAAAVVLASRLWHLGAAPLPDHDSARNWLTIQAVAAGDFRDLFVHLSPSFYLVYAPLAPVLGTNVYAWLVLNAVVGVIGIAWLTRTVARAAHWPRPDEACLTLVVGLGTLYTFTGRELAINSPTLVVLAGIVHGYYGRLHRRPPPDRRRALLGAVVWLAVGLTINYKLALLLPIGGILELVFRRDRVLNLATASRALGLLALPFVAYAGVAEAVGLPWYRLGAGWLGPFIHPEAAGSGRGGLFHPDVDFYFRYLIRFESPLVLVGLLAGPWVVARGRGVDRRFAGVLLAFGSLLVLLSFLLKAPRGLLTIVGPLTLLGALAVGEVMGPRRRALTRTVLLAAALTQTGTLWREIWRWFPPAPYAPPYQQVAAWLQAHGARRVATTASLGLVPAAASYNIVVREVTQPDTLRALVRRGAYRYVLVDNYCRVVGYDSLRTAVAGTPVLRLSEPALLVPLLFLEHAEFTGETYAEALARQQRAAQTPAQLTLLDTQAPAGPVPSAVPAVRENAAPPASEDPGARRSTDSLDRP